MDTVNPLDLTETSMVGLSGFKFEELSPFQVGKP